MAVTLDAQLCLIDIHIISIGTVSHTIVHPRDIFRAALLDNAVSFILVHNHPSGDTTPSSEDLSITRDVVNAAAMLRIPVRDHIIIGHKDTSDTFLSMRENGLATFDSSTRAYVSSNKLTKSGEGV